MADEIRSDLDPADGHRYRIHLCVGLHCAARGSRQLMSVLQRELQAAGVADEVEVLETTCRNRCDFGPSLNVYPGPVWYNEIDAPAVARIVREHLVEGNVVEDLTIASAMRRKRERDARKAALRTSRGA